MFFFLSHFLFNLLQSLYPPPSPYFVFVLARYLKFSGCPVETSSKRDSLNETFSGIFAVIMVGMDRGKFYEVCVCVCVCVFTGWVEGIPLAPRKKNQILILSNQIRLYFLVWQKKNKQLTVRKGTNTSRFTRCIYTFNNSEL